jgi:hypothetical protein
MSDACGKCGKPTSWHGWTMCDDCMGQCEHGTEWVKVDGCWNCDLAAAREALRGWPAILRSAGVINIHGCLVACPGGPHSENCETLRAALGEGGAACKTCGGRGEVPASINPLVAKSCPDCGGA